jgi:outer membrane protein TolC
VKAAIGCVLVAGLWGVLEVCAAPPEGASTKKLAPEQFPGRRLGLPPVEPAPAGKNIVSPVVTTIDLASALRLAGVENPAILQARERVLSAVIERQLAAAAFLPSANAGLNYDSHTGPLQQSNGNILKVNRSALYVGAGSNAVAAGTVGIPGVVFNYNVSEAIFGYLASRQLVAARRFASRAMQNEGLRRVSVAYLDLLAAEERRAVAYETLQRARRIRELCVANAKFGRIRPGDAERSINEHDRRAIDLIDAEREVQRASAALAELVNLDPSVRLHPAEERLVPMPIVPDPIPLGELLAIALLQRPEMGERRALVRQALLQLSGAKLLPFSPNVIIGFSSGSFGGGSDIASGSRGPAFGISTPQPTFGDFGPRNDFDVIAYWTLQNLGIGNVALVRLARSKLSTADLQRLQVLNRIRAEVATAYVRTHVRFAEIAATEAGIRAGDTAYREDYVRVFNARGLPLELLDSFRLWDRARLEYLNAIADYNRAQLNLYVAMGQPPADSLARPYSRGHVSLAVSAEQP